MWSHNLAPTSSGPGIADLPWVAVRPISLAYSGDMVATVPVPRVAICQMPMKARNSAIDTIAARKRSEEVMASAARFVSRARRSTKRSEVVRRRTGTVRVRGGPGSAMRHYALRAARCIASGTRGHGASRRLPDLETVELVLRLRRIEGLAHHHKALAGRSRRRQPGLGHQLGGVGREIDLRGDPRIIQIALDLTPALHLRHDPDRKRLPRERVEIDAVRLRDDIAQPVRKGAGENLFQYDLRLV